ncbi:MAG: DUF58 domain-containing protein [Deltaproteobacteria bacterium]|nr:DUF58 domain-containing protein [Deltaproteobacteria bacterium]
MSPPATPGVLDFGGLARFDGLTLHVRRGMGERPGERRFPGRAQASGVEIEAYSPYTPGDDLRHLDWSAMARLDQLLVRRFTAEREVRFHVLLDASASMDAPPEDAKRAGAHALAVALAYVGLAANDAVQVACLRGDGAVATSPVYRHRRGTLALAELLAASEVGGAVRLGAACEDYARRHPEAGAALLVSDFMTDSAEVERGILALQARRFEVHLLHVIGASELDPAGHFTRGILVDVETGATHPMVLTSAVAGRYREVLEAHLAALREVAARTRCTYARWTAGTDLATFVTVDLAQTGLVRRR